MKTTQKTQKNTKFQQQKLNPSWGLTHPPTSEFFSDFWICFNLTKPLTSDQRWQNGGPACTMPAQHSPNLRCYILPRSKQTRGIKTMLF